MKPMLAATLEDLSSLKFPLYASPKLDGIRCLITENGAVSRTLKPIPNLALREKLKHLPVGLDGELIVGSVTDKEVFQRTTSNVMSKDKPAEAHYYVFDVISQQPFEERWKQICMRRASGITIVEQTLIKTLEELTEIEQLYLEQGYEGVMLRYPDSPYKFGRSTLREGYLMKLKRFKDLDATVIGFEELMHNDNEATKDNLGRTKRSSAKAGKRPGGTLGALICTSKEFVGTFRVGAGFTPAQRAKIWGNREHFLGMTAKVKYQEIGTKDAPRIPVFLDWRMD